VLEIPLAAGVNWMLTDNFAVDTRLSYRVATGEDMLGIDDGPGMDAWNLAVQAGWQF
jgi:hypothetical protein